MNNKSVLTMIEQVIAVLVFTVAAAICIKVFAYSSILSNDTESISNACIMIQNAAELVKNTSGDINRMSDIAGWIIDGDKLIVNDNGIIMEVSIQDTDNDLLGKAEIVLTENDVVIKQLEVFYQKPYHANSLGESEYE